MIYLVFATHVLLDCLTAYGTQIFWPLSSYPVAISSLFIIDPSYTLPLLLGVICALVMTRDSDRGHLLNRYGLILSGIYLGWSLVAKVVVESNFRDALAAQEIAYERIFTVPSPFNTLLWRAVARDENGYYEGYYSIFDEDNDVRFNFYPSQDALLTGIEDEWSVQRLQWFSHGFYSVSERSGDIVISDLRMGSEPYYVFQFKVAEIANPHPRPVKPEQLEVVRDLNLLRSIWPRIWDPSVGLEPPSDGTSGSE